MSLDDSAQTSTSYATKYLVIICLFVPLSGCTFQIENMLEKENTDAYERGEFSSQQYSENQQSIRTINP